MDKFLKWLQKTSNFLTASMLAVLFLTTSCGFKIINQSELINYSITEIETTGDKRINYNLKNNILSSLKNDKEKKIALNIETQKNKTIKEKNIKNEITKYQISIAIKVKFKKINEDNFSFFEVLKSANYSVSKQYSQTLNNEKKLIDQLTNDLANKILEELIFSLNAI